MRFLILPLLALAAGPALAQDRTADDAALAALERRGAEIAREVGPAIVSVIGLTSPARAPVTVLPGLLVVPPARDAERIDAVGFLVSADGLVATTSEISHEAVHFAVQFSNGETRTAELVGHDEGFGIALLRVDPPAGSAAITESSRTDVSERAVEWMVTPTNRTTPDLQIAVVRSANCPLSTYDRFLAAPVVLRAGSAGGPLIGRDGKLLGMAVASGPPAPAFDPDVHECRATLFIRGDDVLAAAKEIAATGRVRHARIGVLLDGETNHVEQLLPGGPADLAGLREGDEIVALAGADVTDAAGISRTLVRRNPGETVPLAVRRGGETVRTTVVLDDVALPPLPTAAPLPGATLSIEWTDDGGAPPVSRVTVTQVSPGSAAAAAGLAEGDEFVSADGLPVRRFLQRHRVRPAADGPVEIVVRRGGEELRIAFRR